MPKVTLEEITPAEKQYTITITGNRRTMLELRAVCGLMMKTDDRWHSEVWKQVGNMFGTDKTLRVENSTGNRIHYLVLGREYTL